MNTLEERLRSELRAESETIAPDSIVDLRLPRPARRGIVRRSARPRAQTRQSLTWARPLAAAAAVVAVAAGTVLGVRGIPGASQARSPGSYTGFPLDYAYLKTSTYGNGDGSKFGPAVLILHTATGAVLTKVEAPSPYNAFVQISSDAAGNTFVFAVGRVTRQGGEMEIDGDVPFKFLMLRVTPGGHKLLSSLPLSLPVSWYKGRYTSWSDPNLAVSPDGSKVALAYGGYGKTAVVRVMNLATQATRTWTLPHTKWAPTLMPQGAWTANGRTLAIPIQPDPLNGVAPASVFLLDTNAPGTSLASARGVTLRGSTLYTPSFLTPDGTKLIGGLDSGLLGVFSTQTGALLRTLPAAVSIAQTFKMFWSTPSGGRLALFQNGSNGPGLGVLTANGFKADGAPLPRGRAYERLFTALSNDLALMGR